MSSHVTAVHPTGGAIPRPELGLAGKMCLALLVRCSDWRARRWHRPRDRTRRGAEWDLTVAVLAGSPFPDFLVPGLVLAGVFGVGSFIVVAMGIARLPIAPFLAFAIGCAQMIWITVELAIIKEFSFLHPTFFAVGLLIARIGRTLGLADVPAWRSDPLTGRVAERGQADHHTGAWRGVRPSRPHPLAIVAVKLVHTAIFLVELASILWLVVSGVVGRRDRSVAVAAGLVAIEAGVFVANAGVCPLTPLTERLGASRGSVSDIFLPGPVARTIPVWSSALVVLAVVLHARSVSPGRRPRAMRRGLT